MTEVQARKRTKPEVEECKVESIEPNNVKYLQGDEKEALLSEIKEQHLKGVNVTTLASRYGVSRQTIYNWLEEIDGLIREDVALTNLVSVFGKTEARLTMVLKEQFEVMEEACSPTERLAALKEVRATTMAIQELYTSSKSHEAFMRLFFFGNLSNLERDYLIAEKANDLPLYMR